MATLDKPKIYSLIKNQVPEFVREDYPTFIAFLEAYYQYLQTINVDIKTTRDIETTADEFVAYFKKELAENLPNTVLGDEKLFLTRIKELYESKGTESSFKFLFRALFDKEIGISYPSAQILRCDDGKWNKDTSLFVRIEYGVAEDIVGRNLTIVTSDKLIDVFVDRVQSVYTKDNGVVSLSDDVYEIFIDRDFFGIISTGDRLQFGDTFRAEILPTTTSIEVVNGGKGFRAGQIFPVEEGDGYGSFIKVKRTDIEGTILNVEFVKYGVGYLSDFNISIIPEIEQLETEGIEFIGEDASAFENLQNFSEYGFLNKYDYNIDSSQPAFDGSYAGQVVRQFSLSGNVSSAVDPSKIAILFIKIGSLADYPGFYSSNDGFLDDAIYIQDDRYYQAFSYVIQADLMLSEYSSILKDMLHPAGMALFGEYTITNSVDLSLYVETAIKSLMISFVEKVYTSSAITARDFSKGAVDDFTPSDSIPTFVLSKPLADEITAQFTIEKGFSKSLSDNFSISETSISLSPHKYINDELSTSVSIPIFVISKNITDTVTSLESGVLFYNGYTEFTETYWGTTYSEGATIF